MTDHIDYFASFLQRVGFYEIESKDANICLIYHEGDLKYTSNDYEQNGTLTIKRFYVYGHELEKTAY